MERLGYEFASMLVTLVCISYFASQKFALILPGTYSSSHKEKKADKVCICKFNHSILSETGKFTHRFFYKPMFSEDGLKCHPKRRRQVFFKTWICRKKMCYFVSLSLYISFSINTMICMNLVVNSVLF